MSDYHRMLAAVDAEARDGYDFDPRVTYHIQNRVIRETMETAQQGGSNATHLNDPAGFAGIPEGSHSDSNISQPPPKTVQTKRYVVIDAAQRDWTLYPNPYSNLTFVFGNQSPPKKPEPVYTNNRIYPSFALPPTNNPNFIPNPGYPNLRGFSYVDSNTGAVINLSAYNSSLPRGNFVAFDTSTGAVGSGDAFGCPNTPCNVTSLRLVRAVLPQSPFVSYPTDPVFLINSSGTAGSNKASPFYTFGTYPYLLFYVNEYRGQYYGPTEASRRAFSVLTQCNRAQIDFTLTNGPQYFEYVPWNNEALVFQSPLTQLQKLQLTVTDPHGVPFGIGQEDTMAIDSIRLATAISGGQIYVSRATLLCVTPAFKTYPETQLRTGDRVAFHTGTLNTLMNNPAIKQDPDKRGFLMALLDQTFPVLDVKTYVIDPVTNTYVPGSNPIDVGDSRVDYFNVFFIPNFTIRDDAGNLDDVWSNAVDAGTNEIINVPNILGAGSTLPFINVVQQPVFTFELEIATPDTSGIGGKVVN